MTKNIAVVDEQGNQYEATYPKRARGLVKNGRARFIGENKICLACPPDYILEEKKMTNSVNKLQVFNEITELRKSLTSLQDSLTAIMAVREAAPYEVTEDDEVFETTYDSNVALEKINVIREVAVEREKTISKMLDFHMKLYQDLDQEEAE